MTALESSGSNERYSRFGNSAPSSSPPTELEVRARAFAEHHHEAIGHRRQYTREPYIVHPAEVVELVRSVPHSPAMIAASWAHDTVEDTAATLDDVRRELGEEVATLVEMLTDVSTPQDGNRKQRKAIDLAHTAKASAAAATIKLADLISNSSSILQHDPKFAAVFLAEKAALLEVLKHGDPTLHARATQIVCDGLAAQL